MDGETLEAQGGTPAAGETEPTTPTATPTEERQPQEGAKKEASEPQRSRARERIRELTARVKTLEAAARGEADEDEEETPKTRQTRQPREPEPETEPAPHPALKGLETNEYGEVNWHGTFVAPETAVALAEQGEQIALLADKLEAAEEAGKQAEIDSRLGELFEAVEVSIRETRETALPNLKGDLAGQADDYMLTLVDRDLTAAINHGEDLTDERIAKATEEALAKARSLFGAFGDAQIKDNANYQDKNRVKPDGTPGTPAPLDFEKMSRRDRDRVVREIARKAEAATR